MTDNKVCGRFAPSPTGPLHFGSLVAALGSYLSARSQGGAWRVRMEDLDPPREVKGAADDILRTLEVYGFEWDGEILCQSRRREAYEAALDVLRRQGALYACGCTRKEIADSSVHGIEGPVYPGTCRAGLAAGRSARALRVRTDNARSWNAKSVILSCVVPTDCMPISWRWWWTTPSRALRRLCAAPIC